MFESESSFVISRLIGTKHSSKSVPFILPSDPNGNFEIVWELIWSQRGYYITTIGMKWQGAQIGSIQSKEVNILVTSGNYRLETPLPMTSWKGSNFPETSSGSFMSAYPLTRWTSVSSAKVFIEFTDISGVKLISDSIPMVEDKYIEIHSNQSPISNNVRIYFPSTKLDLWTTESSLIEISDYFSTLLSSEFAEGTILTEIKTDSSMYEKDFEDSDDEGDGYEVGLRHKMKEDNHQVTTLPFKEIKIDAIAHSTFRAFLHWIQTSHITFAPISSTFRLQEDATSSRRSAIDDLIKNSNLPRPVSPKSIYRLAHYYNIPTIKELAIDSIKNQLTVENIAFEVFGDLSKKYEEIRDIYVDFTVDNWNEVSGSKAMTEMERLAEIGEIEISLILMKISRKLKFIAGKQGEEIKTVPVLYNYYSDDYYSD